MSESEYDSSDSPVYMGHQAAEVDSESDSEDVRAADDTRKEEAESVQEEGGTGITGVTEEFEGDEGGGEGSSGEDSAAESSDGSEGGELQEGDTNLEEGGVDGPAMVLQSEAVGGKERLGEEGNVASPESEQSDREERGIGAGFEVAEDGTESRLRELESSPSDSAGIIPEDPAGQNSFQDSGQTGEKDDGSNEFDKEEVTDVVASTTRQVARFLKDSDSENSDLELDLSGESGAVGEKGVELEGDGGEKGSEGGGEGVGDGEEKGEGAEMREEVEGEGSQSTLEKSFTGGLDDVFGEESDDEEVGPRERKRRREPGEEGSPSRKKIRDSDASSEEGGVASGAEESAELQEEVAELQTEGDEGVPEVGAEGEEGVPEEGEKQESDDDLEEDDSKMEAGLSDWDIMMQRRKEAMALKRRRRKGADITLYDDSIMAMIRQMKQAAEEDRQLNLARKTATKKLQMLSTVVSHLKKSDLQTAMIECGILTALAEWMSPLPDHSLPHLKIRESILDILKTYPVPDSNLLKSSKMGKAVMLLYRHPKETKKNREKAGKLINEWARPIFGLASDFKSLSRDEREERDYANISQAAKRRLSSGGESKKINLEGEEYGPQKPGDKGWVGRARVPMPSTRDYVVRPKWNVEQDFKKGGAKKVYNRYEKHLQKQKKPGGKSHAISISVEGRQMPL